MTAVGGHIEHARRYELAAAIGFAGQRARVYDGLVRLADVRAGDQVLDIGCGTGYLTRRAAMAAGPSGRVVGIDPSPDVVAYANEHAPTNTSFQLAGAERLPLGEATFDVVVTSLAIHHIPPADRGSAFAEMFRVLKPGGRLLVADFRPPRGRVLNHLIGALSGHAMQHNPIDELPALITSAGFDVAETGDRRPFLRFVRANRP
ncbi:class I SAM-dependent methyltransferase [Kribbella sp. NPDC050820]|uniref:class I SAM-dependent methyltransferase n=1 Tax=Kribbella sp. NPDC050820 TaxID=3155408 RepID=UPI0033F16CB9